MTKKSQLQGERLQKVLANAGFGSRREIERWIQAGEVVVNGEVASLGDRVMPEDRITVRGRKVGSFGELAAFSLNSSKNLTGGEGGLLVMDDDEYHMRAKMLRMFGDEIDDETKLRKYNASILGYQYRNLEMPAALARSQLRRLDEYNEWRIQNCSYLTGELGDIPGVHPPYVPDGYRHVYWMYVVY